LTDVAFVGKEPAREFLGQQFYRLAVIGIAFGKTKERISP
jgi:hypothetical protein